MRTNHNFIKRIFSIFGVALMILVSFSIITHSQQLQDNLGLGMNSNQWSISNSSSGEIVAGLGVKNSGVVASTSSSTPTGILFDASVTISNRQSTAIPNNYNQKVTVNSNTFAKYEKGNLANVEWYTSTGTVIPSWIESGDSNTSSNTVYWLLVPIGIGANSNLIIYMGFAAVSSNLFNTGKEGVAPQLTINDYGQYDNGGLVFQNNYWNFKGTSLPSGWTWTNYKTSGTASEKVNNGITINFQGNWWYTQAAATSSSQNYGGYAMYAYQNTTNYASMNTMFGEISSYGGSVQAHGYQSVIHGYVGTLSGTYSIDYAPGTNNAGTNVAQTSSGPSANSWYLTEEAWPSTGTEYANYYSSTGSLIGALTGSDTQDSFGNTYLYLGMYDNNGGGGTVDYQYVFLATLLPNNVMPSATISPIYSANIQIPNNVLEYVPVIISNTQNTPTGSNYDQKVVVDSITFSAYEAGDLQNVEWFTSLGQIIPSWIGGGDSNQTTSTYYWLKIPFSVGAFTNATIYMGFTSKLTDLFGNVSNEGLSSQLLSPYGVYDNGAVVFQYYNNGQQTSGFTSMGGASLSLTKPPSGPAGYPVQDYLQLSPSAGSSGDPVEWINNASFGSSYVVEGWMWAYNSNTATYNSNTAFSLGPSKGENTYYTIGRGLYGHSFAIREVSGTSGTTNLNGYGSIGTGWSWVKVTNLGGDFTAANYTAPSWNGGFTTHNVLTYSSGSNLPYVGLDTWNGVSGVVWFANFLVRTAPPNGVMPAYHIFSPVPHYDTKGYAGNSTIYLNKGIYSNSNPFVLSDATANANIHLYNYTGSSINDTIDVSSMNGVISNGLLPNFTYTEYYWTGHGMQIYIPIVVSGGYTSVEQPKGSLMKFEVGNFNLSAHTSGLPEFGGTKIDLNFYGNAYNGGVNLAELGNTHYLSSAPNDKKYGLIFGAAATAIGLTAAVISSAGLALIPIAIDGGLTLYNFVSLLNSNSPPSMGSELQSSTLLNGTSSNLIPIYHKALVNKSTSTYTESGNYVTNSNYSFQTVLNLLIPTTDFNQTGGSLNISAYNNDYSVTNNPGQFRGATSGMNLKIKPAVLLEGHVTNHGNAASDQNIAITEWNQNGTSNQTFYTSTDQNGSYRFMAQPGMQYNIKEQYATSQSIGNTSYGFTSATDVKHEWLNLSVSTTPPKLYSVDFSESGLPSGAPWTAKIAGQSGSTTAPSSISVANVPGGTDSFSIPSVTYGTYGGQPIIWVPTPSSGSISVPNQLTVSVSFQELSSVTGTTLILLSDGTYIQADQLEPGMVVSTYNFTTNSLSNGAIERVYTDIHNQMYEINGKVNVSADQLFWTGKNWISSEKLKLGEEVFNPLNGKFTVIHSINVKYGTFTMYGFEISRINNFIAWQYLLYQR